MLRQIKRQTKSQGQYIIVLSDDSDLASETEKAKSKGAEIIQEYKYAIKGLQSRYKMTKS